MTHTGSRRFPVLFAALATLALAGTVLALLFSPVQAQEGDAPAAPTGLASEVSHDSVTLTWDDPGDDSITGYRILRRETDRQAPGVFTTINRNTGNARTAYTDGTVEPETRYVYGVKALNAHGVSGQSNYADADTPAAPRTARQNTAPSAPGNLKVADGDTKVTLRWDAPPTTDSITKHQYRFKTDGDYADWTDIPNSAPGEANASGYTVMDLTNGTAYTFQVRAHNGAEGVAATTAAVTPTVQISATIAADHANATFKLDNVPFTVTLGTAAPTGGLTVTVALTQDQPFLPTGRLAANTVTFAAGSTEQTLNFPAAWFLAGTATADSTLTATIVDGNGYAPGTPATADVAMKVFGTAATVKLEQETYTVEEGAGVVRVVVVVETAAGVPQPRGSLRLTISTENDTATSGNDFANLTRIFLVEAADYVASGSVFQARKTFMITILDDSLDEADTERFIVNMGREISLPDVIKLVDAFGDIELIITAFVDIIDDDLSVGVKETGELEEAGEEDWFSVILTAGKFYMFEGLGGRVEDTDAFRTTHGTLRYPHIRLYDAARQGVVDAGVRVDSDNYDDTNGRYANWNANLWYAPTATGPYYVQMSSSGTGTYTVRVRDVTISESTDEPDGEDFANGFQHSGALAVNDEASGRFDSRRSTWVGNDADMDFYRVNLKAGTEYSFTLVASGITTSCRRAYIEVRSYSGLMVLAYNLNFAPGSRDSVTFTPRHTGSYIVSVSNTHTRTGCRNTGDKDGTYTVGVTD